MWRLVPTILSINYNCKVCSRIWYIVTKITMLFSLFSFTTANIYLISSKFYAHGLVWLSHNTDWQMSKQKNELLTCTNSIPEQKERIWKQWDFFSWFVDLIFFSVTHKSWDNKLAIIAAEIHVSKTNIFMNTKTVTDNTNCYYCCYYSRVLCSQ